jgi:hypothetical protein
MMRTREFTDVHVTEEAAAVVLTHWLATVSDTASRYGTPADRHAAAIQHADACPRIEAKHVACHGSVSTLLASSDGCLGALRRSGIGQELTAD